MVRASRLGRAGHPSVASSRRDSRQSTRIATDQGESALISRASFLGPSFARGGVFGDVSSRLGGGFVTRPRCLEPGRTYFVTRRCVQGQGLLKPEDGVNEALREALLLAARSFGVEVHAFVFLLDRYHLVVSDTSGSVCLPRFMACLNRAAARGLNAHWGRRGSVWEAGSYEAVRLIGREAVLAKIAETLTAVVAAGLLRDPKAWLGLRSLPGQLGARVFGSHRPGGELELKRPPAFGGDSPRSYRRLVSRAVRDRLAGLLQQRRQFLGLSGVAALSPIVPVQGVEETGISEGAIACADEAQKDEALSAIKEFIRRYRKALAAWRRGRRRARFPAGTYWMRRFHGVRCEPLRPP